MASIPPNPSTPAAPPTSHHPTSLSEQLLNLPYPLSLLPPSTNPTQTCSICHQAVQTPENPEIAVTTPCGHITGNTCIRSWLASCLSRGQCGTCPTCRAVVYMRGPTLISRSMDLRPGDDRWMGTTWMERSASLEAQPGTPRGREYSRGVEQWGAVYRVWRWEDGIQRAPGYSERDSMREIFSAYSQHSIVWRGDEEPWYRSGWGTCLLTIVVIGLGAIPCYWWATRQGKVGHDAVDYAVTSSATLLIAAGFMWVAPVILPRFWHYTRNGVGTREMV